MGKLTLQDALGIRPGEELVFDPDLTSPAISDQVYGIEGLTKGMSLKPGERYEVEEVAVLRGEEVTVSHFHGNYISSEVDILPSDSIKNVVFKLKGNRDFGYNWFSK